MTALLVIKYRSMDEIVTVSRGAAAETGSRIGLRQGEKYRLIDLLKATLIRSANDACHALASHVSGNESMFVAIMNKEAKALGLRDTHFTNACGHDNTKHYSTASDLAVLAEEALKYPVFKKIVSTKKARIKTINNKRRFTLRNTNKLMGRYPGVMGVKTGYTGKAGKCLITVAERDGGRVMLVLLNSPGRWRSAPKILNKAFAEVKAIKKGTTIVLTGNHNKSSSPGYSFHRVRRGESLWSIARKYGTSVTAIAKANNISTRSILVIGQKLKIP